jgi:hypothetical protein
MDEIAEKHGMVATGGRGAEREPDPEKVIWRWAPERKKFDENDPHRHDDIAEEYVIEARPDADSGIVTLARYHGVWSPFFWSERPIIVKLLAETGIKIELPRQVED